MTGRGFVRNIEQLGVREHSSSGICMTHDPVSHEIEPLPRHPALELSSLPMALVRTVRIDAFFLFCFFFSKSLLMHHMYSVGM